MKVIIAGGAGFLGSRIAHELESNGHEPWSLTRRPPAQPREIGWDGFSVGAWREHLRDTDAIINATGYGLEHWPWSIKQKQRFRESRILPTVALVEAIKTSTSRPRAYLQISGINYYGARGEGVTDESFAPGNDYLAHLSVEWESASERLVGIGIRRVLARSAVVLDRRGGLLPLMALPVRLGIGGPLGDGRQAMPWIHIDDEVRAIRFLLEREEAGGPFNLIAPTTTSNALFMSSLASGLRRPCWLPIPAFMLRAALGEMSTLVVDGRYSRPGRLLELGFEFKYSTIETALANILRSAAV
jgi:uncharacterized protein